MASQLAERLAGLARFAADVNAEAAAERYKPVLTMTPTDRTLLYLAMKAAGASEQHDELFTFLGRVVAADKFEQAAQRRRASRRKRRGQEEG